MGDRPTEALWGVGPKTSRKLAELGISTVRQLATADVDRMRSRFGPTMGPWFVMLGRGVGSTSITDEPWVRRGLSHQTTFPRDLTDRADDRIRVEPPSPSRSPPTSIADDRWIDARGDRRPLPVVLHADTGHQAAAPTQDPAVVAEAAIGLLDRLDLSRPVRLLGVRAELTTPDPTG